MSINPFTTHRVSGATTTTTAAAAATTTATTTTTTTAAATATTHHSTGDLPTLGAMGNKNQWDSAIPWYRDDMTCWGLFP